MNCPLCQKSLPDENPPLTCPACGGKLNNATEPPPFKIGWLWFWIALIAPPVLTALSAALTKHTSNAGLPSGLGFFGGGIGGLVCGIVLGIKVGKTTPARVVLSLVFAGIMVIVCIMLCFFGCSLGGYQLDLK